MIFVAVSLFITLLLFAAWVVTKNRTLFLWLLSVANGTLVMLFLSFAWRAFPDVRTVSDTLFDAGGWGVRPMADTISMGTALEFVLLCVAWLSFLSKKKLVAALLWSVAGIGLFAIVGHAAGVPWMTFAFGTFSSAMPVVVAVAFIVLAGIGLVAYARADELRTKDQARTKATRFRLFE